MNNGEVISPENAQPITGPLPKGKVSIKVLSVEDEKPNHPPEASGCWEITLEYPDGFVKSHQIAKNASIGNLVTAIRNQLKGRHGLADAGALLKPPAKLDSLAGKTLTFGG